MKPKIKFFDRGHILVNFDLLSNHIFLWLCGAIPFSLLDIFKFSLKVAYSRFMFQLTGNLNYINWIL